ncbi:hypothetical protein COCON_G00111560 [Conger conger]|uniref:C2H2-type domain-containing protein n=1 Tax=Conger conger TaxID=82655 RepID=A0A9Q1DJV2_CONCO|nr:hypothetical protein COCON_G00111560 [Conger conger]
MAAASESGAHPYIDSADIRKDNKDKNSRPREIIKPSITELTKEVRTNILCTVEGCGKILPNTPALNMHLVKSHRVKDGLVNPTVRKSMKGSQKLYCCPVEGCPRGTSRPFSQFSLVKQHFMKMHAEKKHKCTTCSNCYSTEWDLRRHAEDCGKTFHCTCGCPYASRAALLSHIYRTGHELPTEHRYPPVKKRKMDGAAKARPNEHVETQTNYRLAISEDGGQIDQAVICEDIFNSEALGVSTQSVSKEGLFRPDNAVEEPLNGSDSCPYDSKSTGMMCFSAQTDLLHPNPMADNQTQTMTLFSDFEKMLSDSMDSSALESHSTLSDATASCEVELASDQEQTPGIDFDFEEFLNAVHIQTQTEESELLTLSSETHLESLDIETQTDFLFFSHLPDCDENGKAHSNDLGLEMFDTQTQTDLNFLLDTTSHIPLGNFLKQSSFSVSTESTDMETQTDMFQPDGSQVTLSSTETQTVTSSFESLGSLFLTSNETQTVMDDFLTADLAWNMDSHLSSVETQTSDEFFSLFQHPEKPNS